MCHKKESLEFASDEEVGGAETSRARAVAGKERCFGRFFWWLLGVLLGSVEWLRQQVCGRRSLFKAIF